MSWEVGGGSVVGGKQAPTDGAGVWLIIKSSPFLYFPPPPTVHSSWIQSESLVRHLINRRAVIPRFLADLEKSTCAALGEGGGGVGGLWWMMERSSDEAENKSNGRRRLLSSKFNRLCGRESAKGELKGKFDRSGWLGDLARRQLCKIP